MKIKQYGGYARVSDTKKKSDGERRQDVERQIEIIYKYFDRRGISKDDIEMYIDDGKSAFTEDLNQRPNFKRLLNDCRRHYIKEFIMEDLTRFSRNLSMGLQWLKLLGELNVQVISLKEGEFETTSVFGWQKSTMFLMFAELDSRMKSEKVKSGMKKARNLGKHVGRPKKKGGVKNPVDSL